MKARNKFKPNRSFWNYTFKFSYSPCILSILQYGKICHAFYKIASPVYLRDYLSKGNPQLNPRG